MPAMHTLIHDAILHSARRTPDAPALCSQDKTWSYAALASMVQAAANGLLGAGITPRERVAVYLEKRVETVASLFGACATGAVMVPVNPLLKAAQVAYILGDCNVKVLVTSTERLAMLADVLAQCPDLHTVVVVDAAGDWPVSRHINVLAWEALLQASQAITPHRAIDTDMAAILYTSGSTGKPKGVVLSHRNLVAGAASVAGYLGNTSDDRILAALPLSFDYGLSQLTTAFHSGACAVLMNYLLPADIPTAVAAHRITGLAAVPALWMQLARQQWPDAGSLRYATNSGGAMPRATLDLLRAALPTTQIFLMYGLTEAFRSTYLPPSELDRRPDSIGRAIPNAEVMVVRSDGSRCAPNEPGELVHRGALVALGYWNDAEKTAERFKPAPLQSPGLPLSEPAVWSGDMVRMDEDGFLYFIGRSDDLIKVSGYRISPSEIEEVILAVPGVIEAAAFGVTHPTLGQAIVVAAHSTTDALTTKLLLAECRRQLPAYMVPAHIALWQTELPRNANGKIDRKALQAEFAAFFDSEPTP